MYARSASSLRPLCFVCHTTSVCAKTTPLPRFFFLLGGLPVSGGDKPAPYAGVPTRHPMGSQNALFLNFLKFGKFPVASPFGLHNYVNFEIHGVHQRAQMAYCF